MPRLRAYFHGPLQLGGANRIGMAASQGETYGEEARRGEKS